MLIGQLTSRRRAPTRNRLRSLGRRAIPPLSSAGCLVALLWAGGALAQAQTAPASDPGFLTGLFSPSRANLLGDMGGLRTKLGNYGVTLNLVETSEVLGNVSGGIHTGFDYDGLTTMTLQLDTGKAFGWEGGTFNASALQIHGRNLAADNLQNLQTPSGIEASRATRLWELWYQQSFLNDLADVKLGQQSIDQEFMGSQYSALFLNTMMGWPMVPSVDLFAGGPAYPLSSLGVRGKVQPIPSVTLLGGVFNDNPPGGPFDDDSQLRGAERSGTKFNLNTGALFIAEVQYAINQPAMGDLAYTDRPPGLPGTYKLGMWYDTARFPDQRFDNTGLSLADPASSGVARTHSGNFSVYGVVDQMVWRPDFQSPQSVGVFARLMGAPSDRNLVDFSVNAGVNLKAPFHGRDDDTVGIGYGLANISGRASDLDRDSNSLAGAGIPVRSKEQFIELTYQYQAAAWWQIQPDFQYVFNPGAGIANPNNPTQRVGNEAIIGVRTIITF
jgi:porin